MRCWGFGFWAGAGKLVDISSNISAGPREEGQQQGWGFEFRISFFASGLPRRFGFMASRLEDSRFRVYYTGSRRSHCVGFGFGACAEHQDIWIGQDKEEGQHQI